MRREWEPEDLIESWTLIESDWQLVANKRTYCGFRGSFTVLVAVDRGRRG